MIYENQICPGCGNPMHEGEDIVVCPECATPQHRECYNKLGSCVNGYLHASKYVWQPDIVPPEQAGSADGFQPVEEQPVPQQDQGFFCPICGTKNVPGAQTCENCGNPLPIRAFPFGQTGPMPFGAAPNPFLGDMDIDENENIGGETAGNIAIYLRKNQRKFLPKFKKFAQSGGVSWNWAAFFLSPFYFFYRRSVKVGALFMGVFVAISLCVTPLMDKYLEPCYSLIQSNAQTEMTREQQEQYYNQVTAEMTKAGQSMAKDPIFVSLAGAFILAHIISGLFADKFIYSKVLNDIKVVREACPEEMTFRGTLYRVGGTSFMSFVCSYFAYDLICTLLMELAENFIS